MESSKLVALLKQFEAKDWKDFQRFIESSYFNRRPKLVELYKLLRTSIPKWNTKKLTNKYINSKLYPNETYIEKRLIELRNIMVKLIEQYWLINQTIEPTEQYRTLALAYHQNGFPNYRDYFLEKSKNTLEEVNIDAEAYHSNLYNLSLTQHKIVEEQGKRNVEPNLQALHDSLDAFFLCAKLKYYCKVLNYQNFRSHAYNISLVDAILEEAKKDKYKVYPAIQIYYNGVFTLIDIDSEANFYALKNLLIQQTKTFSKDELQNMFVLARNFCLKNLNRGKRKFIKDALDLYKIEIEEQIILEENLIPNSSCRNIVKLALMQGEINWVIDFLNKYKDNISSEIYSLGMANVHFEQQQYKAVLELLSPVNFKEVLLELAARGLILKTYFQLCRTGNELQFEDKLEAYIESFKAFLNRKKEVLTRGYLLYLNLVNFVNKLNKLYWKPKLDTNKYALIRKEILDNPQTAEWDWLKEVTSKQDR